MAKFHIPRSNNQRVPLLEPRIMSLTVMMFAVLGAGLGAPVLPAGSASQGKCRAGRSQPDSAPARAGAARTGLRSQSSPLVDTRPSFDAQIVPEDSDNLSLTIERLARYTGADDIADKISDADEAGRPPYEPITVAERLGWQQVVALEAHQLDLPGVSLQITPARHYLYGQLAAHLLGYVGEVTVNDLQSACRLPHGRRDRKIRPRARVGKFSARRRRRTGDRS